jgi:cellulose 1,4-beta-cellobiosidase
MFHTAGLLTLASLAVVYGQQAGNLTTETHPKMAWQLCRKGGSCTSQSTGEVVLDGNWRWLHHTANFTNCYEGNEWDASYCASNSACAKNCALDGADYRGTYGISVSSNALTLKYVTKGEYGTNIGSRVYMMNGATKYQMFKLMNKEFTFDVDLSGLGCGLNGALYFIEMPENGGSKGNNKAGAKFGTGYCDAQCPHDMKFIDGEVCLLSVFLTSILLT